MPKFNINHHRQQLCTVRSHTFGYVNAMDFDAEDKHVFARIVGLRLRSNLWNCDSPVAEVAHLVGRYLVTCDVVENIQLTATYQHTTPVSLTNLQLSNEVSDA